MGEREREIRMDVVFLFEWFRKRDLLGDFQRGLTVIDECGRYAVKTITEKRVIEVEPFSIKFGRGLPILQDNKFVIFPSCQQF